MTRRLRTQVGIIGAGPAGLFLAELLRSEGIDTVVIEARDEEYVRGRIRAGVLEQGTVEVMKELGIDRRVRAEGLVHEGFELCVDGVRHRIDLASLCGRTITIYGQQEVVKDLLDERLKMGGPVLFGVEEVALHGVDSDGPSISFLHDGEEWSMRCDYIAGCDGFHGVSRPTIPPERLRSVSHDYPYAWLGILVRALPASEELIYANHSRGFALLSMRSPTVTRLYLQVEPAETLSRWSDDRIWTELRTRLATTDGSLVLDEGEIIDRSIAPMRSYVSEPMQCGRLFLAGDAAHIVPPTGAKGLNLAVSDVWNLSRALAIFYEKGNSSLLNEFSARCLGRVWRVQQFSSLMTRMLHRPPGADAFAGALQSAALAYLVSSRNAAASLAENYAGLPLDGSA